VWQRDGPRLSLLWAGSLELSSSADAHGAVESLGSRRLRGQLWKGPRLLPAGRSRFHGHVIPHTLGLEGARRHGGRWLTVPRLWVVVVLGAIGVMQLAATPSAIDLAYHVKAGELMVEQRAVLRTDVFAWPTAGRSWVDQNWGAQVLLYAIWRVGGFPLLAVSSALCTVAAWGLVAAACRRRMASLRVVAAAVLAGYLAAAPAFSARPQMFSVLLFAIEVHLLEVARTRPRIALVIPLLMPLWANLHGAFVVGLGLLAIEVIATAWRRDRPGALRFLVVGVLSAIGLLANPWGAGVLAYAALLPANRVVTGMVTEWAPASLRDPTGAMLMAAIGILVIAMARSRAHAHVPEQVLRMALLAGLALWAVRASVWFGLALPVAICVLTRERAPRPADADRGVPLASGLVLAALAIALAVALPPVRRAIVSDGASKPELTAAPAAAAGWLAANPQPGRMFNFQPWGSYLEFRLGPRIQPAVDSRIELLPAERWRDYLAIAAGRWDAERLLGKWGVDYVVTGERRTPSLTAVLAASERWRLAFSHGDERVYVRVAPRTASTRLPAR
jgi:hypothetical protein